MTDKELSIELEKWLLNHLNCENKWNRPTGKIIRKYLEKTKNWKCAPRGNPAKGWAMRGKNKEQID